MSQRCNYFKYEVMKVSKTIVKVSKERKIHIKSLPINTQQGLDTVELQSDCVNVIEIQLLSMAV